jgi:hypothetical protein
LWYRGELDLIAVLSQARVGVADYRSRMRAVVVWGIGKFRYLNLNFFCAGEVLKSLVE